MKSETAKKLEKFVTITTEEMSLNQTYKPYEHYIMQVPSGEGMVGENSYLLLWKKNEIEELNDIYETHEFLRDVILIGSDGGDMAYGIDIKGRYIEVPFIGMDDEEIKVIGNNFDDFITYVWNK
ncbi:MAG: SMI1/KNR4 family protein [Bacteroidales bacterium]|nr:SMI1/KNR4 family protein [Bacteroidales bacterium]